MEVNNYNNYLIFKNGSVLSKGSKYNKPRFLKLMINHDGYKFVNLRDGKGGGKICFIHRLLAQAYIPNPDNKPFIDHIDRCRTNNSLYNLRWATRTENNNNMTERKINCNNKTGHKRISKTSTGYRYVSKKQDHRKRFKTLEEAIKYKQEYENA